MLQREAFATKWFADKEQAAGFLETVSDTHIWDVSDRPLLLTLLCALYQSGGDLPRFKVDLYKECVELALRRWDAFRSIKRETAFDSLSLNQRLTILAKVGAQMTTEAKVVEETRAIDSWFRKGMEESGIEGSATELREEIVGHSGLLIQVALDKFSFSHKSLQEYFAALYFARVDPLVPVSRLRHDRQWLATTEMTACMVSDAGKILLALLQSGKVATAKLATDLDIALRILSSNPVTIAASSRERLVQRLVFCVQSLPSKLIRLVPIWHERLARLETEHYSTASGRVLEFWEHDCSVYVSWRETEPPADEELRALGLTAIFLLRLLIPAKSTVKTVGTRLPVPWLKTILASAAAHAARDKVGSGVEGYEEGRRMWPFVVVSRE